MTNFDRIKSMSAAHMAELLTEFADADCQKNIDCDGCNLRWFCEKVIPDDINANLRWLNKEVRADG